MSSIPGSGRSPGGGHGNPLQYPCLENPMDRGVWQAAVHGVTKSQTWLKWLSPHAQVLTKEGSVQLLSRLWLFATPWTVACQASLSITNSWSPPNSYPLSWWCHPTSLSSVVPFYSRLQCFEASGSFQMSQHFESGGQSIGVSASASVLPMNIQDWFPLGWTCLISLQSKGLSRVFFNTTVQKHEFFSTQLSL